MNHGIHGTHGRKRGWWRSRLFWLGVPGLIFLGWLWVDSHSQHIWASCRLLTSSSYFGVGFLSKPDRLSGWIGRPYIGLFGTPFSGVRIESQPLRSALMTNDPGPWKFGVEGADKGRLAFEFDLWFVLLVYCTIWLLACFLWQRRKRRMTVRPRG